MSPYLLAKAHFSKAFKFLSVEDDGRWIRMISTILESPFWDLQFAKSMREASAISKAKVAWSLLIADIDLNDSSGATGIDVLKAFPFFPSKIVLSGLKSVEEGYKAGLVGAKAVFDKSTSMDYGKFRETVAKFAAMGYMLNGRCPNHENIIWALVESSPVTVAEWIEPFPMERRRWEQLCPSYLGCSPKEAIRIYQALTFIQLHSWATTEPGECHADLDMGGKILEAISKYPRPTLLRPW